MKTLELNQMEQIEGGRKGWLAGWGCAITIAAFISVGTATAGAGTHYIVYTYTDGNSCTSADSTMIVVNLCTSISENASLDNINIYPNPTNGLVHINLTNHNGAISYTISTIEGRVVTQKSNVNANNISVNLSNESKGIYLLKIEDRYSSIVYKIIRD